jgi:MFS family permease
MAERAAERPVPSLWTLLWRAIRGQVVRRVGGPARARVIIMFALVLALNGADTSTVGAIAPQLQSALHIGTAEIGLLASVSLVVGAVFTIPVGLLVDRTKRMPLLAGSILLWSVASLLSAFAGSYSSLLLTRLLLGAVAATAGPAIASLTGDYFPAAERGRVWAYILGGEVAGTAVGFIVSGSLASLISWRAAFVVLAIPGFFLARELYRTIPEPLRGGQSYLEPGESDLNVALAAAQARADRGEGGGEEEDRGAAEQAAAAKEAARRAGAVPNPALVLHEDPSQMRLVPAVRYILSIPSNFKMIIGSSLGYFYFAGLTVFALEFVKGHYHVSQAEAELVLALLVVASIIGTLVGGRLTDRMLRRGSLQARVWVPAVCYLGAALTLIPAFVETKIFGSAIGFVMVGAALLSAAGPPIQAARLDVMPSGLWGRAESTRTFIRSVIQALAPLLFGGLTAVIAGFYPKQSPIGTHAHAATPPTAHGLEITFLILLASLLAAGLLLLRARVEYPSDVATAAASEEALRDATPRPGPPAAPVPPES